MGLADYLEKKAHQTWLKRAMDISWIAVNGIGMVFGPLLMALETGNPNRAAVEELIGRWLTAWQELQNQSDRILGQSRDDHGVRSHEILSPILLEFQRKLEAIRGAPDLDGPAILAAVTTLNADFATCDFLKFNQWIELEGTQIGFDTAKYQHKAVKKAHKFWEPTVQGLTKGLSR